MEDEQRETYNEVSDYVQSTGETLREAFTVISAQGDLTPSQVQQHYYRHKRTLSPKVRETLPSEYGGYTQRDAHYYEVMRAVRSPNANGRSSETS